MARITDSRQRWNTTRNTTTVIAVSPTIVGVSPNSVPGGSASSPSASAVLQPVVQPGVGVGEGGRLQHLRDQQPDQDHDHADAHHGRTARGAAVPNSCHRVRSPAGLMTLTRAQYPIPRPVTPPRCAMLRPSCGTACSSPPPPTACTRSPPSRSPAPSWSFSATRCSGDRIGDTALETIGGVPYVSFAADGLTARDVAFLANVLGLRAVRARGRAAAPGRAAPRWTSSTTT